MKIRLLTKCFINNSIVNAGEIVDWPDDVKKPMRSVHRKHDHILYGEKHDAVHLGGDIVDEPLWEEVKNG